jgi:hypothetical protein
MTQLVPPLLLKLIIVSAFYEGLCACASLHPDIPSMEDTLGGSDLWTADNFDDADEEDTSTDGNVSKWRRTE